MVQDLEPPQRSPSDPPDLSIDPTHLQPCNSEVPEKGIIVSNLSISIVPEPSLVVSCAQTIKTTLQSVISHITPKRFSRVITQQEHLNRDLAQVGVSVLRNVSLDVQPGQVCLILGASGAGKSTLLNTLAGRMKWSQVAMTGSIDINGEKSEKYWKSTQIGFLYQTDQLDPWLTPRETLEYVTKLHSCSATLTPDRKNTISNLLLTLGLKDCADRAIGLASECHTSGMAGGGNSNKETKSSSTRKSPQSISGGEKRRVSLAMQLVTDPSILFCDEPTSGLDAFASYELIKTLIHLAKSQHKTIVVSIHQPRPEIFHLLAENHGQLVLLSLGNVIYSGPISGSLSWFDCQTDLPPRQTEDNPFEYMLDLCSIDHTSELQEQVSRDRLDRLAKAWNSAKASEHQSVLEHRSETLSPQDSTTPPPRLPPKGALRTTVAHTVVLAHRGLLSQMRNKTSIVALFLCYVLMGLWTGGIFFKLSSSVLGIRARSLAVMLFVNMVPLSCMAAMLYRMCNEVRKFDRERKDRWYGPLPFVLSSFINNLPMAFLAFAGYSICVYLMVDLRRETVPFFVSMGTLLCLQIAISSFPIVFSAVVRGFVPASALFFCISALFILTSGTHVQFDKIPGMYAWIKHINFLADAFRVLESAEFTDRVFDCPFDSGVDQRDPIRCKWYDGNQFLKLNGGLEPHFYPGPIFLILFRTIVFLLLAWVVFTFKVVEPSALADANSFLGTVIHLLKAPFTTKDPLTSVQKPKSIPHVRPNHVSSKGTQNLNHPVSEIESKSEEQDVTRIDMFEQALARCVPVEIRMDKVSLSSNTTTAATTITQEVDNQDWFQRSFCLRPRNIETRHLLKEIDFTFASGELTAILGASGAGKTSLLNIMLHRSPSNLHRQGDIWFNGSKNPSLRQINAICGYVRQDDSFLHSHLTVRETLRYAAELSNRHEKNSKDIDGDESQSPRAKIWSKVEQILEMMGLHECGDVLVGEPGMTGCSGGQRRRLSIALQLILEPSCLILDEPTTGLDATSALSLIQTLKAIARTGRTVVCTIHQPRAAIWDEFDKVMLLMPGGLVGYAGQREHIPDFLATAGFPVSEDISIPDFVIDIASVNYASEETENESRQRILKLAATFQKYRAMHQIADKDLTQHDSCISATFSDELSQDQAPYFAPFTHALPILARRMFKNESRQTALFFNRICLGVMVGLVPSSMLVHMDWTLQGLMMRVFYLNQLVFISVAGVFTVIGLFPKQKQIAFYEISSGLYGISAFLCSYIVNSLPHELVVAAAVTATNFWLVPLEKSWINVGVFYMVVFGYFSVGESVTLLTNTWTNNECISLTVSSSFMLLYSFTMTLINSAIPKVMRAFGNTSVWSFGIRALSLTQIADGVVEYPMDDNQNESQWSPIRRGQDWLNISRMSDIHLGVCLAGVMINVVVYRVLVWISLLVKVRRAWW